MLEVLEFAGKVGVVSAAKAFGEKCIGVSLFSNVQLFAEIWIAFHYSKLYDMSVLTLSIFFFLSRNCLAIIREKLLSEE